MDEQIHNDDGSYQHNVCNKLLNTDGELESRKSFSVEGYWKRIQSIRNGECQCSCDVCHESFRQKGDMRRHQCKQGAEHHYLCNVRS